MSGRVSSLCLSAFAAFLYGCGSNAHLQVAPVNAPPLSEAVAGPQPPKCKGQVIDHHHAEVTARIPKEGATLCVPSFHGFGGFLGFPSVHPAPQPVKLIVTVPELGMSRGMSLAKHKPIFNLEWLPSGQFTFGKTAPPGGISGATMTPGKTYTGYGVMYFKGDHKNVGPCYSVAAHGKYGGVFNHLGTLMERQGGSFLVWDLMIYEGKEANRRC